MFEALVKIAFDWKEYQAQQREILVKSAGFALVHSSIRLTASAQQDLKTGKLGLRRLSYMTDQSDPRFKKKRYRKNVRSRQMMERAPLTGLFRGITNWTDKRTLHSEVGFRGVGGTAWQKRIAVHHLRDHYWSYSDEMRAALHKVGVHLKKTTTRGRVPARDIMGAVWDKYQSKYWANYNFVFVSKMQGKRVAGPKGRPL